MSALNPLVIASGALLIAVAPDGVNSVLTAIDAKGISLAVTGEMRPTNGGVTIVTNTAVEPITPPDRDEIARALKGGQANSGSDRLEAFPFVYIPANRRDRTSLRRTDIVIT